MATTTDWAEILEAIDVPWCAGCDEIGPLHEHGFLEDTPEGAIFHWQDRRVTRPGLHKAFRKIVVGTRPDLAALPHWRALYLRQLEILKLGRKAGVRMSRSGFDLDRARLRYELSRYNAAERRRMTPSEQRDFTAALRWAARS